MAASYGSGLQSPPHIGRPVDRVFEEAQFTGEVFLNGRKLRDYPKICSKYDLSDTTHVDVSRNRLTDIPVEFCDYLNAERINCYHNVIRSIPDAISQLQTLTYINLSRNQLTVLTPALCMLGALEVLSASNNKLVSLPEEIGRLENLMDLDVSCNEISHLPLQIGDMSSLRCLNLRRNFLVELPIEISRLQLCRLDFSSNRIEKIPTVFRKMESLEQFILDHNPLSSPPAYICTKGRQHIMKFLHIEAIKEDRKRGIMINSDSDMKRFVRKSLPPQQSSDEMRNMLGAPESKWKRHTVLSNDSGYNSTGDLPERNGWHSGETHPPVEDHSNANNSRMFHPHYRNPPVSYNNQQHVQGDLHQSHNLPQNQANSVNMNQSRPEYGAGLHHQVLQKHASQHATERQYMDSTRHEQMPSKLPQQQQEMAPPSFGYQHQQQPNQRKATSIPVSVTPRRNDRGPSPSQHGTRGVYSTQSGDVPPPGATNSSKSPSGFYQTVPNTSGPIHSRQGSNTSQASDMSSSSRTMHLPYQPQQQQQRQLHSHLPPPPPASLHTDQGSSVHNRDSVSSYIPPPYSPNAYRASSDNFSSADEMELPPPPLPPPYREEAAFSTPPHTPTRLGGQASPPLTPPTPPMVITGDLEDEFTRELKRQKAEYDRKKRQAEQIRVQQEEEEEREKEARRKAALKLQEEQRLLMERQEEQKRQEERLRRQEEEERERAQEEERRRREEEEALAAQKREEELQRLQEAVRIQAEEDKKVMMRNTQKQPESKGPVEKNKLSNNSHNMYTHRLQQNQQPYSQQQQQQQTRPAQAPPPPPPSRLPQPPSSLPLHSSVAYPSRSPGSITSPTPSPSRLSQWQPQQQQQQQQQNNRHHHSQQPQHHVQQKQDDYILSENDYRNSISSQSLKEHQRLNSTSSSNGSARAPQQYRRAASDGLRKPGQPLSLSSQVDSLNYINRNGVAPDGKPRSRQSSTSTTPSVSPGPSPRNSISHLAKPVTSGSSVQSPGSGPAATNSRSPMGSQSHLAKPKSSVPRAAGTSGATTANGPSSAAASAQSQAVRRAKTAGDRSNVSSPVTVRSTRMAGPGGVTRAQGSGSSAGTSNLRQGSNGGASDETKKAVSTPTEPTTRLKSRLAEPKYSGMNSTTSTRLKQNESADNKRINTRPPTSTYGSGRGRAGNAINKTSEESSFTIRRREEHHREEAEQMDRLRQTVESRLRVTLPDNLPEALRDGVVLCHLANQIRPRSVGSIHVPSPAVPKLTLAKCRRNVDNFLDACRKIGVDQEQICGPQDIFDEKGITRVALTVAALVAIGTNPKQSAV